MTEAQLGIACSVYPAAELLLSYCVDHLPANATVLELGSGTGWFGIELSQRRPDLKQVCMTDMITRFMESALDSARGTVDGAGSTIHEKSGPTMRAAQLMWGEPLPDLGHFDYVIGSDLVYSENCARLLCVTLRAILEAGQYAAEGENGITPRTEGHTLNAAAETGTASLRYSPGIGTTRARKCLIAHHCERFMWMVDPDLLSHLCSNRLRAVPLGLDADSPYEYVHDTAPIRSYNVIFAIDLAPGASETPVANPEAERVLRRALRHQDYMDALMSPEEKIERAMTQAFAASLDSADDWDSGILGNARAAIQAQLEDSDDEEKEHVGPFGD